MLVVVFAAALMGQTGASAGCSDQTTSFAEVQSEFARGRVPSSRELTGSWVAIGMFGPPGDHLPLRAQNAMVDCAGVKRGNYTFEAVLTFEGYSVRQRIFGNPASRFDEKVKVVGRALVFEIATGGDSDPDYRCRISRKGRLVCVTTSNTQAREFKAMPVADDQLCQPKPNDGSCLVYDQRHQP